MSDLAADSAYGSGKNLAWLVDDAKIAPYITVFDKSERKDGTFSRADFSFDKENNIYMPIDVACVRAPTSETLDGAWANESASVLVTGDLPSHSCALAAVTGRMFNQKDQIKVREKDWLKNTRTYECADEYEGLGELCTTWHLSVSGDNHLLDYSQEAAATCFSY